MPVYNSFMQVGFVYDDIFLKHETPVGHPECKDRLVAINKALKGSSLWNRLIRIKPEAAAFEDILKVHDKQYIDKLKNFGQGYIDPDTYISKNSFEAALFAAGAVVKAVDACKENQISRAFCAVRPPGHHAEAGRAMGFCLLNNIAVGARYAQKVGYKKIFIVDFDVHHGNGTQHIFEDDDTVFYFSTHEYPHYPGTGSVSEEGRAKGKGFTCNIPMAGGSGDADYFYVYNSILPDKIRQFGPDIIMVSAGYDIHRDDPLASMLVSNEGVRHIVKSIISCSSLNRLAHTDGYTIQTPGSGLPVIFTLEGGYDLSALSEAVLITLEASFSIINCE